MSDLAEFGGDRAVRNISGFLLLQYFSLGLQGGDAQNPAFLKQWGAFAAAYPKFGDVSPSWSAALWHAHSCDPNSSSRRDLRVPSSSLALRTLVVLVAMREAIPGEPQFVFYLFWVISPLPALPERVPRHKLGRPPRAAGRNPGGTRGFGTVWDCAG